MQQTTDEGINNLQPHLATFWNIFFI